METASIFTGFVDGIAEIRRRGGIGFPVEELVCAGEVPAGLGRDSSLRIFLGRGRRVRLSNGTEWRIKSATSGPYIIPTVKAPDGTVAIAKPLLGKRSYGLNGLDFGYTLIPLISPSMRHSGRWALRRRLVEVAEITGRHRIDCREPVEIAAVLLAFTLVEHGIPGEAELRPRLDPRLV